MLSSLKRKIDGIVAVKPEHYGSKESRAAAVTPLFEAGNVYLPDPSIASWVGDYVEELAAFPNGTHDDQVDATSQALIRMSGKRAIDMNALPQSFNIPAKWNI